MSSGYRETSKPHFEIYYEAPWGGVASDLSQTDIQPNQFVVCDGLTIRNGILCYTNIAAQDSEFELTLITPTGIAPYGSGGNGAYVNVAITNIAGIPPASGSPPQYPARLYTVASTAGLAVGTTFNVSGNDTVACNITDTIARIISGTQFSTNTSILTSSVPVPSVGGELTYWNPNVPGVPVPQDWPDAYICLIFNASNYLCAIDQYGFAYIATLQNDGTVKFQLDKTASDGPTTNHGIPTAVKVVAGVAYISVYGTSTLYAYTPTISYIVASTFTAGQFIDIFDEYMVQLNCNSTVDGIQPTLFSWSSPDQFSVWDPSVNRTAGFQLLTSVEDYITGFVAVDNVGYIFKREGVTQITATGVAIQPFNFTTYWNSVAGQGLIFPQTLKQFGRIVFLATDSDVYQFYGGVFTPIAEPARAAIYSSFNLQPSSNFTSTSLISSGFSIYPYNDTIPISEYIFIAITASIAGDIIFWFYQPNLKAWTSLTLSAASLLGQYVPGATNVVVNSIKAASIFLNPASVGVIASITNFNVNITYINFTYTLAGVNHTQTYLYFNLVDSVTANTVNVTLPPGTINLKFRQEEIKLGRKPTIRRVVVRACGTGTLQVNVGNVSFGTIILDGTSTIRTYLTSRGIYTGEDPQLSITSENFIGQIIKAMMAGSYAYGDID